MRAAASNREDRPAHVFHHGDFSGVMTPTSLALDRAALLDRFTRLRSRTRALFDLLDERVYYERPIALRNPIVFYEGHLPAFSVISFLRRGLGRDGVNPRYETLFARGID